MITFLHGKLVEALPSQVTIDVHGVGYEVQIPASAYDRLPAVGAEVRLLTHLAVREDAHVLYGFLSSADRDLFRVLIHTVSGIGPKTALSVLGRMSVQHFRQAVAASDIKALGQISGVGKKTAERIIVELRDKLGDGLPSAPGLATPAGGAGGNHDAAAQDAMLALMALGVKPVEAQEAIRAARAILGPQAGSADLTAAAFKRKA